MGDKRDRINNRMRHLQYTASNFANYNLRALMGTDSIFDVLTMGEFTLMNNINERLQGGGSMFCTYDSSTSVQNREIQIPLIGSGSVSGKIEFEVEREHGGLKHEMSVRVRNAPPGSTQDVSIGGVVIGQVTIDSSGFGRVDFSTDPGGDEVLFPGGVAPVLTMGTEIKIGNILQTTLGAGFDSTDGSVSTHESKIFLSGSTSLFGIVEYEVEPEDAGLKTEFQVDVRNATPGATLNVFVSNVDIGDVVIGATGRGVVRFSTDPDVGELQLPANFPSITVGTTVRIDDLASGTFSSLPATVPGGTQPVEVEFRGGLRGSTAATGGAKFEKDLEDGGFLEHEFRVHVRDAVPGSVHDIRVAGVLIGQITADATGRGVVDFSNRMNDPRELALPDEFPAISNGTRVDVGNILSGFLNLYTPSPSSPSRMMGMTRMGSDQIESLVSATPTTTLGLTST